MKAKYSKTLDNINPYPKKSYRSSASFIQATRSAVCYFCNDAIEINDMFWWYPNSKRSFHFQCKGLSKNSQKGVTTKIMTPEELEIYRAQHG